MTPLRLIRNLFLILTVCARPVFAADAPAPEPVWLRASDGYSLRADYYAPASRPKGAVILLHMLGRDRSDWRDFALALREAGYAAIVPDLRGHGESKNPENGRGNWKDFSPEDFRAMARDAEAAHAFLKEKGASGKVFAAGGSIGANLALVYASRNPEIAGAVLLSPGLDYRGVQIARAMRQYEKGPVLMVAAADDEYSDTSCRYLLDLAPAADKKFAEYPAGAGHGTQIFKYRPEEGGPPELSGLILDWLDEKSGPAGGGA